MKDTKLKNFLLGSILVGGLATGISGCSNKDKDDKPATEVETPDNKDIFGNIKLFEQSRSDIKFALAFVENYYPYIYWCGEAWTTGHGLTILYNADGTYKKVTQNTKVPTLEESDVYKGRYLTFEILPDIKDCVTVRMDENTLIAACALRYCIGGKNFKKSTFLKQLNAGKTGAELAKTLTGWRQQDGVLNRCYFFAALMAGKIEFSDLLDLRAEGCYNLSRKDIIVYTNGQPKCDKNGFYEWDFSKVKENLEKAKQPRTVSLNLGKKSGHVKVHCKPVKDIVPEYIWQEVSHKTKKSVQGSQTALFTNVSADAQNDTSYIAYKNGNYKKSLESGKAALKLATTNKQRSAACYNIGISYLALEQYGKAVKYLKQSVALNQTKDAQTALDTAKQKQQSTTKKIIGYGTLCLFGCGAAFAYGRKQRQHNR